jgi:hypothetical protein
MSGSLGLPLGLPDCPFLNLWGSTFSGLGIVVISLF